MQGYYTEKKKKYKTLQFHFLEFDLYNILYMYMNQLISADDMAIRIYKNRSSRLWTWHIDVMGAKKKLLKMLVQKVDSFAIFEQNYKDGYKRNEKVQYSKRERREEKICNQNIWERKKIKHLVYLVLVFHKNSNNNNNKNRKSSKYFYIFFTFWLMFYGRSLKFSAKFYVTIMLHYICALMMCVVYLIW